MYRELIYLVLVLGLAAGVANADITTGLIAHYTFDDTLNDSAGSTHGVKLGTGAAVYQAGAVNAVGQAANNKAIRLDGDDDAIFLNHSITSYTDGTIALWAWFASEPLHNTAMYHADYTGGWIGGEMHLWVSNIENQGAGPGPGACGTVIRANDPWDVVLKWNENTMPNNGVATWTHVAITLDAGNLAVIYVNGTPIKSAVPTSAQGFTLAPSLVGASRWWGTQAAMWDSKYDDVRIYNRALSENEVYALAFGAIATQPYPPDDANYMPPDVELSWTPGVWAVTHEVYLGTNWNDVNDANTTVYNPNDVYKGNFSEPNYTPLANLEFGTMYHWRVDEVNEYDGELWKGRVWNFTVEPVSHTLTVNAEPNDAGINTVTPGVGQHSYYVGTTVDVSAAEFANCEVDPNVYQFDVWQGDVNDINSASTSIIMDADETITAVFVGNRECGDQCHPILQGDINEDCYINFVDFALYCERWLSCTHPDCD